MISDRKEPQDRRSEAESVPRSFSESPRPELDHHHRHLESRKAELELLTQRLNRYSHRSPIGTEDRGDVRRAPSAVVEATYGYDSAELERRLGRRDDDIATSSNLSEHRLAGDAYLVTSSSSSSRGMPPSRSQIEEPARVMRGDHLESTIRSLRSSSNPASLTLVDRRLEKLRLIEELEKQRRQTQELLAIVRQRDSTLLSAVRATESRPTATSAASLQTTAFRSLFADSPHQLRLLAQQLREQQKPRAGPESFSRYAFGRDTVANANADNSDDGNKQFNNRNDSMRRSFLKKKKASNNTGL